MKKPLNISILFSIVLILFMIRLYLQGRNNGLSVYEIFSTRAYSGLFWNLIFAWIAVVLGRIKSGNKALFIVWLLWLPNTLYMVTDIKYFMAYGESNIVSEIIFFALYALTGFTTFAASILPRWEKMNYSNIWLTLIFWLAVFGVFVGRYFRLYTWDILNIKKIIQLF